MTTALGFMAWLFNLDIVLFFCWLLCWLLQIFQVNPIRVRNIVVVVAVVLIVVMVVTSLGPVHFGR